MTACQLCSKGVHYKIMNYFFLRRGLTAIACFVVSHVHGQWVAPVADDQLATPAYEYAVGLYNQKVKSQALIYNGPEYNESKIPATGHPYFMEDFMENGTINFQGEIYRDIPMLYDVVKDRIIIEHFDQSGIGVRLIPHKDGIKSFSLYDRQFVHLTVSMIPRNMRPGFYDVLYEGKIRAFAKHRKEALENVSQGGVTVNYEPKDQFFLYKDGRYYNVRSKASLLRVLKDEKKTLAPFIRNAGLNFRANKERAIVEVGKHYDNLKQHD